MGPFGSDEWGQNHKVMSLSADSITTSFVFKFEEFMLARRLLHH